MPSISILTLPSHLSPSPPSLLPSPLSQVHLSNGHPPHPHNLDRPSAINPERGEGGEVAGIKKQLVKSEAQVKELVTTNEQWAIEAGEKASEITVLQIQLQDAL